MCKVFVDRVHLEIQSYGTWINKSINEGILQWFGHVERMENDTIAKKVYVEVCIGSHSVGKLWERQIDNMKEKVVWMSGKQGEWWGFVRGNAWAIAQVMYPSP